MSVFRKIVYPASFCFVFGSFSSGLADDFYYNSFPKRVVSGPDYTIIGTVDDHLSGKLVNLGRKIQKKKNQTVQRYDQKVSNIIDNEVDKTLSKIDGNLNAPISFSDHNISDHRGVLAYNTIPTTRGHFKKRDRTDVYIGASYNYGIFHGVRHIDNGMGTSALIGVFSNDSNLSAEFGLNYNQYNLGFFQNPIGYHTVPSYFNQYNHLEEYSGSISAKYSLFDRAIKPTIGLISAFRYRTYFSNPHYNSNFVSLMGIDVGFSAGLEFHIGSSFSIGTDIRYMRNLHYMANDFATNHYLGRSYLGFNNNEHLDYILFGFATRLLF